MKNLVMFLGAVLFVSAAACSSSTNGSGGGSSCPSVGFKACPNDTAVTQADADACNKCLSQYQAFASCAIDQGETANPGCDSSGNDIEPSQTVQTNVSTNCGTQEAAFVSCLSANTSADGGS